MTIEISKSTADVLEEAMIRHYRKTWHSGDSLELLRVFRAVNELLEQTQRVEEVSIDQQVTPIT